MPSEKFAEKGRDKKRKRKEEVDMNIEY